MSSFYDDASLVVIPSGYKTSKVYAEKPTDGSGDLAFTRTGDTATRVNSAGLIEKVRTNLTLYSQDLTNAAYISGGTGSVVRTGNYAAAPDGTNTATRIQITRGATYQELYQRITGLTVGDEYTLSFYAKSLSGTPTLSTAFNNGYANEVTFTSSWVRYTYTFIVIPTGRAGLNLLTMGGGTSTTADILVWGVQLESGVATAYIPTTTAAVSVGPTANTARLDYLGSTCPRLILEPQRQNLVTFSEQINNAVWGQSVAGGTLTLTPNYGISPDGYQNADRIQMSVTTGYSDIIQVISTSSGTAYTYSVYLKSLSGTPSIVFFNDGTANRLVTLTTEWQRYTFTVSSAGSLAYPRFLCENGVTSSSADFLAWGAQLEQGAYSTSLIPTLAASATRGADVTSKTGILSLIGQTEGTMFWEFTNSLTTGANDYMNLSDGSADNWILIGVDGAGFIAYINSGGVNQVYLTAPLTAGTHKVAMGYKNNDVVLYVDGTQVATDTSASIPATSRFDLSTANMGGAKTQPNLTSQALLFKTRLTNAELAELTTL